MTKTIFGFVLSLVLVVVVGSCGSRNSGNEPQGKVVPQPSGTTTAAGETSTTAIQFTAQDPSGQPQNSSQWIGKGPVVLNFWGTWCPPCRREIPDLVKLYAEFHPRGVEIVSLAVKDDPSDVTAYAARADMKWVMLMANDDILRAYNVADGIPTTIFLDKDGREVTRFIGMRSYDDFKPAFEAILQGNPQQ
ncbi:hypothetical protein C3F09_04110 [candidate division GN15 bacterium]|uniref:Thioredoxin domain-containing protein n=1 Tax=candidate division GN15 bacterium TaxID=2072418 RepID=A0A855X9G6_9BACT|nr:MAG: hypothetical protein C3F09_04110 [candidate division GN15 bacterium]